jgi:hypothetical protein
MDLQRSREGLGAMGMDLWGYRFRDDGSKQRRREIKNLPPVKYSQKTGNSARGYQQ